eukprot:4662731-Prorocentrum_lima.AAC.1
MEVDEDGDFSVIFDQELNALAAMVDDCASQLAEDDIEDLRELADHTYEGLVTIKETHAKIREKAKTRGYQRGT